jgi:DNA-3-methyladenine glycosylase
MDAAPVRRLTRADLPADTATLARWLIGKALVHDLPQGRLAGRIVETEAYLADGADPASHAFRGPTPRNRAMFQDRGTAYVYRAYGISYMLNVASEAPGIGAAVLLRALEPQDGLDLMARHRGTDRTLDLARGPGRLAQALAIGPAQDGADLVDGSGPLWLGTPPRTPGAIGTSVRIGITKAADRPLRFYERGSPWVSGPGRLNR